VLRSAFLFSTTLISFTSVSLMPLAQVVAIAQTTPIYIILLAALVLREGIDRYRWLAVGLGFLGAMIIVRPGTEAFTWAALLPLFGSFVFACYSIATRYLGGSDSVWTTFFYTGLVGACGASLAVPFVWSTPAWADVPLFCLIGALGAGGQMMLIVAMKHVQVSVAAPFLYIQLGGRFRLLPLRRPAEVDDPLRCLLRRGGRPAGALAGATAGPRGGKRSD